MLVLCRKPGSRVKIADNIFVTVVRVRDDGQVVLGFEAPLEVPILREEAGVTTPSGIAHGKPGSPPGKGPGKTR